MGAVFSICNSSRFIESIILRFGQAAYEAFEIMYSSEYRTAVQIAYPFCEPAEIEPFDDFTGVVEDLSHLTKEEVALKRVIIKRRSENAFSCTVRSQQSGRHQSERHSSKALLSNASFRVQCQSHAKQQFLSHVQDTLIRKAKWFRRRYDVHGPPDWIDPAERLLPRRDFYGLYPTNVISSIFPYAAPHIVIHQAPTDEECLHVASSNRIDCQDHHWGNRLIVGLPPSASGPHPSVMRRVASSCTFAVHTIPPEKSSRRQEDPLPAVPNLVSDQDNASSSSEDFDSLSVDDVEFGGGDGGHMISEFWLPEDEEDLPALPEEWIKPKSSHVVPESGTNATHRHIT